MSEKIILKFSQRFDINTIVITLEIIEISHCKYCTVVFE